MGEAYRIDSSLSSASLTFSNILVKVELGHLGINL